MKDLLTSVAKYFITYLEDFGKLFHRPKTFLAGRAASSETSFRKACEFLAISAILVVVITAPLLLANLNLWDYLAFRLLQLIMGVLILSLSLWGAWWLVGARPALSAFVQLCAYLAGVAVVILALFDLLADACLWLGDPEIYVKMTQATSRQELPPLFSSKAGLVYVVLSFLGAASSLGWLLACWGSFRNLCQVSKVRSFLALVMAVPLTLGMVVLLLFLGVRLSGLLPPQS